MIRHLWKVCFLSLITVGLCPIKQAVKLYWIVGGSGFAVVSTAREFSQIRLIAVLIITAVVEIEKHMLAITHVNPHREGWRNIHSQIIGHKQPFCLQSCHIKLQGNKEKNKTVTFKTGDKQVKMSKFTSLFSLSHTHTHFTGMLKCGLFVCQKHLQTMSCSPPLLS